MRHCCIGFLAFLAAWIGTEAFVVVRDSASRIDIALHNWFRVGHGAKESSYAPTKCFTRGVSLSGGRRSTAMFNGPVFGAGGMADTRNPDARVDEDPRKSISAAPSFEEYMKMRSGSAVAAPSPAPAAAAPSSSVGPEIGAGGMADTRNPDAHVDDDVRKSISAAPSFEEYMKMCSEGAFDAPAPTATAPSSVGGGGSSAVDYNAVREELKLIMDNPSWDDGSLAPIFIRLAWHSSGTYDKATGTGGSNGAGMRFANEAADPENAGLEVARAFLEPVKKKFPTISYSDLWILAAYVGIEHTGGPFIPFTPGRTDYQDESYWSGMSYGRLPAAEKYLCPYVDGAQLGDSLDASGKVIGWEGLCTHVRNEVFYRMGFNDQEIVALLCGGHVYGRCHPNFSGYAGPWVEHPTQFSNEYATDMIEDEWTLVSHGDTWLDTQGAAELRPAPGNRQFVNKKQGKIDDDEPNQMMLVSDMILAWDPAFRTQLEVYAADEALLKEDFGRAFKKLTELGCGFL